MGLVVRVHDRLWLPLADMPDDFAAALRAAFTYEDPHYAKMVKMGVQNPGAPEIENFVVGGGALGLPRGATKKLRDLAVQHAVDLRFLDRRARGEPVEWPAPKMELRPHQVGPVEAAMRRENCCIRAPTGSGKTLIGCEIARRAGTTTLIVVWTQALVTQWRDTLVEKFGWDRRQIGILGEGSRKIRPVTIAMQQSLHRLLEQGYRFDAFGVVICDELARWGANSLQYDIHRLPARYRVGLSADERRQDGRDFLVYDAFGEIAAEVPVEALEVQGAVHKVRVRVVPTDTQDVRWESVEAERDPRRRAVRRRMERVKLVTRLGEDEARNEVIAKLAADEAAAGHFVLIFSERVEHCRALADLLRVRGTPCGLLLGGSPWRDRFRETIAGFHARRLRVAVGTQAVYQGLDVPHLDRGIVAAPTATNRFTLLQQAGRFSRPAEGKRDAVMYYLWDRLLFPHHLRALRKHWPDVEISGEWDRAGAGRAGGRRVGGRDA